MRLEPLYVARFAYPEGWGVTLEGPHGSEGNWRGFARPYPEGRRQIVVSGTHLSQDDRYARLNDAVCVGAGEIRPVTGGGPREVVGHRVEFVVEVAELVWEPVPE